MVVRPAPANELCLQLFKRNKIKLFNRVRHRFLKFAAYELGPYTDVSDDDCDSVSREPNLESTEIPGAVVDFSRQNVK